MRACAQVMASYEAEMRHPLRNMLLGQLVRSLLIQARGFGAPGWLSSALSRGNVAMVVLVAMQHEGTEQAARLPPAAP